MKQNPKENIKRDMYPSRQQNEVAFRGIILAFMGNLKKSKGFGRGMMVFFAALLTFGGPTYLMFILDEVELPRLLILAVGLVSLVAGIILFIYLLKEENTSG